MEDMFPTIAESEPEGHDQAFVDAVSWDWDADADAFVSATTHRLLRRVA